MINSFKIIHFQALRAYKIANVSRQFICETRTPKGPKDREAVPILIGLNLCTPIGKGVVLLLLAILNLPSVSRFIRGVTSSSLLKPSWLGNQQTVLEGKMSEHMLSTYKIVWDLPYFVTFNNNHITTLITLLRRICLRMYSKLEALGINNLI